MDKLDAAGADTGVVERLILGPLRPTYPTDVRFLGGVHLDWLLRQPCSTVVTGVGVTASYLRANISSYSLVQAPTVFDGTICFK